MIKKFVFESRQGSLRSVLSMDLNFYSASLQPDTNPLCPNISMHILHTVFCKGLDEENLCTDQKLFFSLVIISFTLVTLMCDSGVILLGEIRC